MKKIIFFALILFLSSATFADGCYSSGCISTIKDLYTNASGRVLISTPFDETIADCTPPSGVYFVLDPSAVNFKEIYATLLAVYLSKEKIQLRINPSITECTIAYVRLSTDH